MYEELIMQALNQSLVPPPTAIQSTTALIVALATAIGTIGSLIAGISAYLKSINSQPKLENALTTAETIGKLATAFGQKTAEQEDELRRLAEVLVTISPDLEKKLQANRVDIDYFRERTEVAQAQLEKLLALIPNPNAKANTMPDSELRREKFTTLRPQ
jgi:predicted transcriptional regulator